MVEGTSPKSQVVPTPRGRQGAYLGYFYVVGPPSYYFLTGLKGGLSSPSLRYLCPMSCKPSEASKVQVVRLLNCRTRVPREDAN